MENDSELAKEMTRRIIRAIAYLNEVFDNVQVFASKNPTGEDGVISIVEGSGNHLAIRGHIAEWLEDERCFNQAMITSNVIDDMDDDLDDEDRHEYDWNNGVKPSGEDTSKRPGDDPGEPVKV